MLGREGLLALEFLDRARRAWYCTKSWAEAVGVESGKLERMAVLFATQQAPAAGDPAEVAGPCSVWCAPGGEAQGSKGFGLGPGVGEGRGKGGGGGEGGDRGARGGVLPPPRRGHWGVAAPPHGGWPPQHVEQRAPASGHPRFTPVSRTPLPMSDAPPTQATHGSRRSRGPR